MEVVTESKSWREELASLVEDTGIRFTSDGNGKGMSSPALGKEKLVFESAEEEETGEPESLRDQIKGFAKAWGEMVLELGRGCRDVLQQTVFTEDSYIVRKTKGPMAEVSAKLKFLNEYLPEDRDPIHAWPVIFFVFVVAIAVLNVNSKEGSIPLAKEVYIHPPSAHRVLLPDGRHMAYHEVGVPANRSRFSLIIPHGFLSSRLAGIPGIKVSLLEEFGVRLITYDLPGFGESDPHPQRNLNSSALDMSNLADSIGVDGKFWLLGYSSGAMHAWGALKYIPNRIAGAAMFAPWVNPYESSMTKEEKNRTWGSWTRRRKLTYYFARRAPRFLSYFYRRTFLSGKHGRIEKWLSLLIGEKDKALIEDPAFEEFWHRDVEESVRQGNIKPFIEEAVLQVSNWGFRLEDLQIQRKCAGRGILSWLKFMYGQEKCELTGFLGPIHLWQGTDDLVTPPSMTEYVARVLPNAIVHKLPGDGHFSYFFFCDECHRQLFTTLFGSPKGPISERENETLAEDGGGEASSHINSGME